MNTYSKNPQKILENLIQQCINVFYSTTKWDYYSRNAKLVEHLKINQCNLPYQQTKEEKSYCHIDWHGKSI